MPGVVYFKQRLKFVVKTRVAFMLYIFKSCSTYPQGKDMFLWTVPEALQWWSVWSFSDGNGFH